MVNDNSYPKLINAMLKVSTYERTVQSLCAKVDDLEAEVEYWKDMYEKERKERDVELANRIEETRKGVANALMFAFAVRDNGNGDLVISKEDRVALAKNWA